jgi:monothiol glutaredoxin
MARDVQKEIQDQVTQNNVVLYMKGTKHMPQCGFSATAVNILNHLGVDFVDVNVLTDPAIRDGVKQFADWPTIPQLYIKGEFIGGCDIMKEMFAKGELQQLVENRLK